MHQYTIILDSRLAGEEPAYPPNIKPWQGMTVEQLRFMTDKSAMDWVVDGDCKVFRLSSKRGNNDKST